MIIYSVESFEGAGYELVLCTDDENKVSNLRPVDYDTNILVITKWENGEILNQYHKEITSEW